MASNYIDDLNSLYSAKVFLKENVGLGPHEDTAYGDYDEDYEAPVRRCLKCDEEAEECHCDEAPSEDDLVLAKKPRRGEYDDFSETGEHSEDKASNMVKQNLYRITKMSAMLYDIIPCDSEIEPWVADKLSKAVDSINSVLGYKDYEDFKNKVDQDIEIEEKTEQDLYKCIDNGGVTLINKIKDLMKNQPREKVEDTVYGMIKMLEA
jgi:hypothetical protein